jgi:hypothetical protein
MPAFKRRFDKLVRVYTKNSLIAVPITVIGFIARYIVRLSISVSIIIITGLLVGACPDYSVTYNYSPFFMSAFTCFADVATTIFTIPNAIIATIFVTLGKYVANASGFRRSYHRYIIAPMVMVLRILSALGRGVIDDVSDLYTFVEDSGFMYWCIVRYINHYDSANGFYLVQPMKDVRPCKIVKVTANGSYKILVHATPTRTSYYLTVEPSHVHRWIHPPSVATTSVFVGKCLCAAIPMLLWHHTYAVVIAGAFVQLHLHCSALTSTSMLGLTPLAIVGAGAAMDLVIPSMLVALFHTHVHFTSKSTCAITTDVVTTASVAILVVAIPSIGATAAAVWIMMMYSISDGLVFGAVAKFTRDTAIECRYLRDNYSDNLTPDTHDISNVCTRVKNAALATNALNFQRALNHWLTDPGSAITTLIFRIFHLVLSPHAARIAAALTAATATIDNQKTVWAWLSPRATKRNRLHTYFTQASQLVVVLQHALRPAITQVNNIHYNIEYATDDPDVIFVNSPLIWTTVGMHRSGPMQFVDSLQFFPILVKVLLKLRGGAANYTRRTRYLIAAYYEDPRNFNSSCARKLIHRLICVEASVRRMPISNPDDDDDEMMKLFGCKLQSPSADEEYTNMRQAKFLLGKQTLVDFEDTMWIAYMWLCTWGLPVPRALFGLTCPSTVVDIIDLFEVQPAHNLLIYPYQIPCRENVTSVNNILTLLSGTALILTIGIQPQARDMLDMMLNEPTIATLVSDAATAIGLAEWPTIRNGTFIQVDVRGVKIEQPNRSTPASSFTLMDEVYRLLYLALDVRPGMTTIVPGPILRYCTSKDNLMFAFDGISPAYQYSMLVTHYGPMISMLILDAAVKAGYDECTLSANGNLRVRSKNGSKIETCIRITLPFLFVFNPRATGAAKLIQKYLWASELTCVNTATPRKVFAITNANRTTKGGAGMAIVISVMCLALANLRFRLDTVFAVLPINTMGYNMTNSDSRNGDIGNIRTLTCLPCDAFPTKESHAMFDTYLDTTNAARSVQSMDFIISRKRKRVRDETAADVKRAALAVVGFTMVDAVTAADVDLCEGLDVGVNCAVYIGLMVMMYLILRVDNNIQFQRCVSWVMVATGCYMLGPSTLIVIPWFPAYFLPHFNPSVCEVLSTMYWICTLNVAIRYANIALIGLMIFTMTFIKRNPFMMWGLTDEQIAYTFALESRKLIKESITSPIPFMFARIQFLGSTGCPMVPIGVSDGGPVCVYVAEKLMCGGILIDPFNPTTTVMTIHDWVCACKPLYRPVDTITQVRIFYRTADNADIGIEMVESDTFHMFYQRVDPTLSSFSNEADLFDFTDYYTNYGGVYEPFLYNLHEEIDLMALEWDCLSEELADMYQPDTAPIDPIGTPAKLPRRGNQHSLMPLHPITVVLMMLVMCVLPVEAVAGATGFDANIAITTAAVTGIIARSPIMQHRIFHNPMAITPPPARRSAFKPLPNTITIKVDTLADIIGACVVCIIAVMFNGWIVASGLTSILLSQISPTRLLLPPQPTIRRVKLSEFYRAQIRDVPNRDTILQDVIAMMVYATIALVIITFGPSGGAVVGWFPHHVGGHRVSAKECKRVTVLYWLVTTAYGCTGLILHPITSSTLLLTALPTVLCVNSGWQIWGLDVCMGVAAFLEAKNNIATSRSMEALTNKDVISIATPNTPNQSPRREIDGMGAPKHKLTTYTRMLDYSNMIASGLMHLYAPHLCAHTLKGIITIIASCKFKYVPSATIEVIKDLLAMLPPSTATIGKLMPVDVDHPEGPYKYYIGANTVAWGLRPVVHGVEIHVYTTRPPHGVDYGEEAHYIRKIKSTTAYVVIGPVEDLPDAVEVVILREEHYTPSVAPWIVEFCVTGIRPSRDGSKLVYVNQRSDDSDCEDIDNLQAMPRISALITRTHRNHIGGGYNPCVMTAAALCAYQYGLVVMSCAPSVIAVEHWTVDDNDNGQLVYTTVAPKERVSKALAADFLDDKAEHSSDSSGSDDGGSAGSIVDLFDDAEVASDADEHHHNKIDAARNSSPIDEDELLARIKHGRYGDSDVSDDHVIGSTDDEEPQQVILGGKRNAVALMLREQQMSVSPQPLDAKHTSPSSAAAPSTPTVISDENSGESDASDNDNSSHANVSSQARDKTKKQHDSSSDDQDSDGEGERNFEANDEASEAGSDEASEAGSDEASEAGSDEASEAGSDETSDAESDQHGSEDTETPAKTTRTKRELDLSGDEFNLSGVEPVASDEPPLAHKHKKPRSKQPLKRRLDLDSDSESEQEAGPSAAVPDPKGKRRIATKRVLQSSDEEDAPARQVKRRFRAPNVLLSPDSSDVVAPSHTNDPVGLEEHGGPSLIDDDQSFIDDEDPFNDQDSLDDQDQLSDQDPLDDVSATIMTQIETTQDFDDERFGPDDNPVLGVQPDVDRARDARLSRKALFKRIKNYVLPMNAEFNRPMTWIEYFIHKYAPRMEVGGFATRMSITFVENGVTNPESAEQNAPAQWIKLGCTDPVGNTRVYNIGKINKLPAKTTITNFLHQFKHLFGMMLILSTEFTPGGLGRVERDQTDSSDPKPKRVNFIAGYPMMTLKRATAKDWPVFFDVAFETMVRFGLLKLNFIELSVAKNFILGELPNARYAKTSADSGFNYEWIINCVSSLLFATPHYDALYYGPSDCSPTFHLLMDSVNVSTGSCVYADITRCIAEVLRRLHQHQVYKSSVDTPRKMLNSPADFDAFIWKVIRASIGEKLITTGVNFKHQPLTVEYVPLPPCTGPSWNRLPQPCTDLAWLNSCINDYIFPSIKNGVVYNLMGSASMFVSRDFAKLGCWCLNNHTEITTSLPSNTIITKLSVTLRNFTWSCVHMLESKLRCKVYIFRSPADATAAYEEYIESHDTAVGVPCARVFDEDHLESHTLVHLPYFCSETKYLINVTHSFITIVMGMLAFTPPHMRPVTVAGMAANSGKSYMIEHILGNINVHPFIKECCVTFAVNIQTSAGFDLMGGKSAKHSTLPCTYRPATLIISGDAGDPRTDINAEIGSPMSGVSIAKLKGDTSTSGAAAGTNTSKYSNGVPRVPGSEGNIHGIVKAEDVPAIFYMQLGNKSYFVPTMTDKFGHIREEYALNGALNRRCNFICLNQMDTTGPNDNAIFKQNVANVSNVLGLFKFKSIKTSAMVPTATESLPNWPRFFYQHLLEHTYLGGHMANMHIATLNNPSTDNNSLDLSYLFNENPLVRGSEKVDLCETFLGLHSMRAEDNKELAPIMSIYNPVDDTFNSAYTGPFGTVIHPSTRPVYSTITERRILNREIVFPKGYHLVYITLFDFHVAIATGFTEISDKWTRDTAAFVDIAMWASEHNVNAACTVRDGRVKTMLVPPSLRSAAVVLCNLNRDRNDPSTTDCCPCSDTACDESHVLECKLCPLAYHTDDGNVVMHSMSPDLSSNFQYKGSSKTKATGLLLCVRSDQLTDLLPIVTSDDEPDDGAAPDDGDAPGDPADGDEPDDPADNNRNRTKGHSNRRAPRSTGGYMGSKFNNGGVHHTAYGHNDGAGAAAHHSYFHPNDCIVNLPYHVIVSIISYMDIGSYINFRSTAAAWRQYTNTKFSTVSMHHRWQRSVMDMANTGNIVGVDNNTTAMLLKYNEESDVFVVWNTDEFYISPPVIHPEKLFFKKSNIPKVSMPGGIFSAACGGCAIVVSTQTRDVTPVRDGCVMYTRIRNKWVITNFEYLNFEYYLCVGSAIFLPSVAIEAVVSNTKQLNVTPTDASGIEYTVDTTVKITQHGQGYCVGDCVGDIVITKVVESAVVLCISAVGSPGITNTTLVFINPEREPNKQISIHNAPYACTNGDIWNHLQIPSPPTANYVASYKRYVVDIVAYSHVESISRGATPRSVLCFAKHSKLGTTCFTVTDPALVHVEDPADLMFKTHTLPKLSNSTSNSCYVDKVGLITVTNTNMLEIFINCVSIGRILTETYTAHITSAWLVAAKNIIVVVLNLVHFVDRLPFIMLIPYINKFVNENPPHITTLSLRGRNVKYDPKTSTIQYSTAKTQKNFSVALDDFNIPCVAFN